MHTHIPLGEIVRVDMMADEIDEGNTVSTFVGHGVVVSHLADSEEFPHQYETVGIYGSAELYIVLLFGQSCPQPFFDFELTIIRDIEDIKSPEPHIIGEFSKI